MSMSVWIVLGAIFILATGAGLFLKPTKKSSIEDKTPPLLGKENKSDAGDDQVEIDEQIYFTNTHKIKYHVYESKFLTDLHLRKLHKEIALENLWIDEPFYSAFFKILLVLDSGNFFIKDPHTKTITASLRDDDNKIVKVKSYQVLSATEVAAYVLRDVMSDIVQIEKDIAKNVVLAILILALHKTGHFSCSSLFDVSELILKDYTNRSEVERILALFDENDESLEFVKNAFANGMSSLNTYPYVEKHKSLKLLLPQKLPQKELLHI